MAMRIITGPEAEQGSAEWLAWRQGGIGASEAASVMGTSPWATAYTLFRRKIGLEPHEPSNYWKERGKRMEPAARRAYELETKEIVVPLIAESSEYPFIRASFDGVSFSGLHPLEIKCPGSEAHRMALAGIVPAHYYDQVQQQLFVSGADIAHYYSFDGQSGKLLEVRRDQPRIDEIIDAEIRFWERVKAGVWSSNEWADAADTWVRINAEKDEIEAREQNARAALISMLAPNEMKREGSGVIVTRTSRKGSVDYEAILAAKGIALTDEERNQFRKKNSETTQVRASKESQEAPVPAKETFVVATVPGDFVLEM